MASIHTRPFGIASLRRWLLPWKQCPEDKESTDAIDITKTAEYHKIVGTSLIVDGLKVLIANNVDPSTVYWRFLMPLDDAEKFRLIQGQYTRDRAWTELVPAIPDESPVVTDEISLNFKVQYRLPPIPHDCVPPTHFRLFDLPPELRDMIYEFLFTSLFSSGVLYHLFPVTASYNRKLDPIPKTTLVTTTASLLSASRTLYNEAAASLYNGRTLRLGNLNSLLAFLDAFTTPIEYIREISILAELYDMVVRRLPELGMRLEDAEKLRQVRVEYPYMQIIMEGQAFRRHAGNMVRHYLMLQVFCTAGLDATQWATFGPRVQVEQDFYGNIILGGEMVLGEGQDWLSAELYDALRFTVRPYAY
ncbi:hypothetical protein EJ05DRAFT_479029 [Pseudovirgaria hyperparasitica]|uniref:Uncharacterized protein n=1 Tax=Pseudovirgaria hyperparasitica TaxID=470096 RepID=A0A6A6VYF1_9PEZI|nr:uncharacterized protein EJ05DRAFT_479029 [Pseudovirgaria hyperparasitica]KAF2755235.1 hypothetical protein EJ05DRAFT_479029 [Pseudovirgaria hyperparasitica]